MAMIVGTITQNPDGTYSGTGMALTLMDAKWAYYNTIFAAANPPVVLTTVQKVAINASAAPECVGIANAIVTYIQANAVVVGSSVT
jgi:hypothetical protein